MVYGICGYRCVVPVYNGVYDDDSRTAKIYEFHSQELYYSMAAGTVQMTTMQI